MAYKTPVQQMDVFGENSNNNDSGYQTNTPSSSESQICSCRCYPVSSTPDIPETVPNAGSHHSWCKWKKSVARYKNLQPMKLVPSPEEPLRLSSAMQISCTPLSSKSLSEQHYGGISSVESSLVSKGKASNESSDEIFNMEIDTSCCTSIDISLMEETITDESKFSHVSKCSQDSGFGSQGSINISSSFKEDVMTENFEVKERHKATGAIKKKTYTSIAASPWRFSKPRSLAGLERVDFLSLLGAESNYSHIVKQILSYLEPKDLTAVAVASKTWNRLSTADVDSYNRKLCYLEKLQINKENYMILERYKVESTPASVPAPMPGPSEPRPHLRQIHNINKRSIYTSIPRSPPTSPTKRRFLQFVRAGQSLESGKTLAPCPRCSLPSQIDNFTKVGQCTRAGCRYNFCIMCNCESHGSSTCPVSPMSFLRCRKRLGAIGSKESKKNLRRL